ncbi:unnamed protein product, partial [Effrenium voratum]
ALHRRARGRGAVGALHAADPVPLHRAERYGGGPQRVPQLAGPGQRKEGARQGVHNRTPGAVE